jgi:hypothetical protein
MKRGAVMKQGVILTGFFIAVSAGLAGADDHYTIHENLHFGQRVPYNFSQTIDNKMISTTGGKQTVAETVTGQHWKTVITVYGVRDGSATREMVVFDPDSYDTDKDQKTKCPYAGKATNLTRNADESITNSFPGTASDEDVNSINSIIIPDEDFFPDTPVAVGDVYDNSAKYALHMQLGAQDRVLSKCRLDWVKTIGDKQMAQISASCGAIYHEAGSVEEDLTYSMTILVDIGAGMIVKCDSLGTSTYSTPPTEPTQVTGGQQFEFHGIVPGYEKFIPSKN